MPVYPQPHARIEKHIGQLFRGALSQEDGTIDVSQVDTENVFASLGDKRYDVLAVLIPMLPKRMPKWQFMGYDSAEQYEAGGEPSEEALSATPTYPELIDAFKVAWKVNRLSEITGPLGKLLDPAALKPVLRLELVRWAERRHSTPSASLPSLSGGSPQTTAPADSGTSAPTSPPTAA